MNIKRIKQSDLSAECFSIQIFGVTQCLTCEYLGKRDCGGKKIRKTLKNEKGIIIGFEGLPSAA